MPLATTNDPVSIFLKIRQIAAELRIIYEGPDRDGNLQFRMPPGTPLLSQDEATRVARQIYSAVLKAGDAPTSAFVAGAPNFKIIAPR